VLVVTSDRGLCGGYNANLIRAAEELHALLREEGKSVTLYLIGRKAVSYYKFRQRPIEQSWTGFSEQPSYDDAAKAGNMLVSAFLAGADDEEGGAGPDEVPGVDELHIVYTEFHSMMTQTPRARRIAPLVVEYVDDEDAADEEQPSQRSRSDGLAPLYEFEPEADELLAHLLPKYINVRIYAALLEAAASEQAARRQAMKAATDNATELIEDLTREANRARQGLITQELSEIVGGAEALAATGSDD
jgi:F-type H+-transporting ATPase subunit gamma